MLILSLISCSALKLSDPVYLKAEVDENVSLKTWCVGVGCVMPFTPASCLSWCDWNVDKQSDAEARGAFAGKGWGKQSKATDFGVFYAAGSNTCGDVKNFYANHKWEGKFDTTKLIFPGGDAETKLATTEIQCNRCYLVSAPGGGAIHTNGEFFRISKKTATTMNFDLYDYQNQWKGKTQASTEKPCSHWLISDTFVINTDQSTADKSKCLTRKNAFDVDLKLGLKGLIFPKTCADAQTGESTRLANSYNVMIGHKCKDAQAGAGNAAADSNACRDACTAAGTECKTFVWDPALGGTAKCKLSKVCDPTNVNHVQATEGSQLYLKA